MARLICLLLLQLSLVGLPPCVAAMSVDEAYRSIPHRKTDFDRRAANMPAGDAAYLQIFFSQVNAAIVARVQTLRWFASHGASGKSYARYQLLSARILNELEGLDTPAHLHNVQAGVAASLERQLEYFRDWSERLQRGDTFKFNASDPRISESHRLLIQSYQRLLRLYPREVRVNIQAFYDHLCALDFI